jgi:hypothetical protein
MPEIKQWTLMCFLASDNPLAPGVISQLKSIKAAGFHKQANVIVQFDPQSQTTPTHIFDVNVINKAKTDKQYNIGFNAEGDPSVHNLLEDKLWRDEKDRTGEFIRKRLTTMYPEYDPGIPPNGIVYVKGKYYEPGPQASLNSFLSFCADFYPANHYILFLLGHGVVVGNDVFMYDEHADEKTLSLGGLRTVLIDFNSKVKAHGGCLDLLSFHSCSVSSLEVAYELKDNANYMLASQGSTLVGNWPYRQILTRIFNDLVQQDGKVDKDTIQPMLRDVFSYCVDNSTDFLVGGYPFDLCLCNLGEVGPAKTALEQLSKALMTGLEYETFKESILLAHLESQSFQQEMYTDILDFCRCLYVRTSKRDTHWKYANDLKTAAGDNVNDVEKAAGDTFERIRSAIEGAAANVIKVVSKSVVRASFAGPEYQYSRGFSVYFPWSRPVDDFLEKYAAYKLVQPCSEKTWLHFLKYYFLQTRRASISVQREKENLIAELGETELPQPNPEELLLEDQVAVVYGQAAAPYTAYTLDGDKPVKTDATDPLGGVYSAPSLKNYPRDTRRLKDRKEVRLENFAMDVKTGTDPRSGPDPDTPRQS